MTRLAESEHIRWRVFKLLEGDCPVPDEILERYYSENPKGRDDDAVRGYHVILRSWDSLKALAGSGDDRWKRACENNLSLVRFALALEDGRTRETGERQPRADGSKVFLFH